MYLPMHQTFSFRNLEIIYNNDSRVIFLVKTFFTKREKVKHIITKPKIPSSTSFKI